VYLFPPVFSSYQPLNVYHSLSAGVENIGSYSTLIVSSINQISFSGVITDPPAYKTPSTNHPLPTLEIPTDCTWFGVVVSPSPASLKSNVTSCKSVLFVKILDKV